MATLERPLKEGNVRTYQEKVGLGFTDILASEADADFDTIYAAWNGGIGTTELKDGAVTAAKIAPGTTLPPSGAAGGSLSGTYPNPGIANLAVTTAKILDGNVTKAKLAADCSQLLAIEPNTPGNVGTNTTAWSRLLEMTAVTLVSNRMHRLSMTGTFNRVANCSLAMSVYMAGVNAVYVDLTGTPASAEAAWFFFELFLFRDSGSGAYVMARTTISGAVPGAPFSASVARSYIRVGSHTGASPQGPYADVTFSVANASNGVSRLQTTLEVL